MPKPSGVQLSPAKPGLQEDPEVPEDEAEAGSDDERAANNLNLGLRSGKKETPKKVQPNGILSRLTNLSNYIGLGNHSGGSPTSAEVEELFFPTDSIHNGEDGQVVGGAEEEEEVELELDQAIQNGVRTVVEDSQGVSNGSDDGRDENNGADAKEQQEEDVESSPATPTGPKKRKRDIYFDKAHPEQLDEGGDDEESPRKQVRTPRATKKRAKAPIILHKKSKSVIGAQRQTRAQAKDASKEPESEANPPPSSSARTNGVKQVKELAKKRGRGRPPGPRKNESSRVSRNAPDSPGEQQVDDTERNENDEQDATDDGFSGILQNSSPVKPIPPEPRRLKPVGRLRLAPQVDPGNGAWSTRNPKPSGRSQNNDGLSDSEGHDEEEAPAPSEPAPEEPADDNDQEEDEFPETLNDVISVERLQEMLDTVKRVGRKQTKKTQVWKEIRVEKKAYSVPGKRLLRRIEKLIKAYKNLKSSKMDGNDDAAEIQQEEASNLIKSILEESEVVLTTRLGNKAHGIPDPDKKDAELMFIDIYFILMPKLVEALKFGMEVYKDEVLSETEALTEVIDLLSLVRKLGEAALRQPKDIQLKPPTSNQYRISSPTSSIMPDVRSLLKTLQIEQSRREHDKKMANWNNGAAERQRMREVEAERELQKTRRKRNHISRMQQQVYNAKLRDPIYGRFLQAETEREEAKAAEMRAARSSQTRPSQSLPYRNPQRSTAQEADDDEDEDMDIQDGPFDDQYERISVFGTNNAHKNRGPKPLSKAEKETFIEIMRFDQDEIQKAARYEKAAKKLGRSMDEIFEIAKDLQETFDTLHENGKFNQAEDEWTYDIWVGQP